MRHGSLFSGIGGFELAAQWMGWENIFHCELNPFGSNILKYYWPQSISYEDITKTDFSVHRGTIDILTGGFPCQPYSTAGKRLGKEDERHLWPEMLRAIREIAPQYVVGENVFGLLSWNKGMVFDEVHSDLEAQGYEVQAVVIPAAAVNAPHGRDRVWFVAYNSKLRRNERGANCTWENENTSIRSNIFIKYCRLSKKRTFTDSNCTRIQRRSVDKGASQKTRQRRQDFEKNRNFEHIGGWETFPTQSPICSGDDGLPTELDGITFSKWRQESIKAYGNAIVPQVALQLFKAIKLTQNDTTEGLPE